MTALINLFNEDSSWIRRGNAAEVMNALRKVVLNVVKHDKTRAASMKRKLKMAALDDDYSSMLLSLSSESINCKLDDIQY